MRSAKPTARSHSAAGSPHASHVGSLSTGMIGGVWAQADMPAPSPLPRRRHGTLPEMSGPMAQARKRRLLTIWASAWFFRGVAPWTSAKDLSQCSRCEQPVRDRPARIMTPG